MFKLTAINLSLALVCGADCIFCPSQRGGKNRYKVMPFCYAEKIINEITSDGFKKCHDIKIIRIGEIGDAFLNKNAVNILRLIRSRMPHVRIECGTNFRNLTKGKIRAILAGHLIDYLVCNIDGASKKNYFLIKKLDLTITMRNLLYFIRLRRKIRAKASLTIGVITLYDYIHTIHRNFGFYPAKMDNDKLMDIEDDFPAIKKILKDFIDPATDRIERLKIIGWAERGRVDAGNLDYDNYTCPMLGRIATEAFILPDGTWYACCRDSNNELIFGNIAVQISQN